LNENNDFFRQGQALLDVADHVKLQKKQWFAGKLYYPRSYALPPTSSTPS
jgi:hypothetical protein